MKKFLSNPAKIYRFSEISSSFNENTDDVTTLFSSTFGSGLLSFLDPSSSFSGEKITDGPNTFYTIRVDGEQKLKFIDQRGISEISDNLVRYSILFDDLNVLNGSEGNPIEFKKTFRYVRSSSTSPSKSSNYSFEDILAIYVNGTPLYNSEFTIENNSGNRRLVLRRIRFGKIFPTPKDKNGKFFKNLIEETGVTKLDLQSKLEDENGYILLEFPFLKTKITDKELVLEVISSTNTKRYYNIPKNFPKYKNGAFYKDDEYTPHLIKVNLGDLKASLSDSDRVRFFFVSKAIKRTSGNLAKKYYVGVDNLSPETSSTKEIFVLDERTGEFLKIDEASYPSVSDLIVFNYQTGEFDILASVLPYSYAPVYFGNISYYPPLKVFRDLDYVNNVSVFGHWGFTWKGNLTSAKNVFIINDSHIDNANATYDNQSNLINLLSSYKIQAGVNESQGILLGTINPSTGSITLDSQIKTPFDRLKDLYMRTTISKPMVYTIRSMSFSSSGTVSIPITILRNGQVFRLYGSEFILRVTDYGGNFIPVPIDISIVVTYGATQQTLVVYSSTDLSANQEFGRNIYKNVNFSSPISYTHNSSTNGIVYLTFNISNIVLELQLVNIYAFIE
jgi:hypothetical protein